MLVLIVSFVRSNHYRLLRVAQEAGDFCVLWRDPGRRVYDEDDNGCFVDCGVYLPKNGLRQRIAFRYDAAGIGDREGVALPLYNAVDAVAGRTGDILYDGLALSEQPIEDAGLPHIRPPHEGNDPTGRDNGVRRQFLNVWLIGCYVHEGNALLHDLRAR